MALNHSFANINIEELFYEIVNDNPKAALELTESSPVREHINDKVKSSKNHILQTCLHAACSKENLQMVKRLLELGADPNVIDSYESTPLHNAAAEGKLEVVKLLVQYRASVQKLKGKRNALGMARMYGKDNVVEFLQQCEPCQHSSADSVKHSAVVDDMDQTTVSQLFYTEKPERPQEVHASCVQEVPEDSGTKAEPAAITTPSETETLIRKVQELEAEMKKLKCKETETVRPKQTKERVLKDRIQQIFEHIIETVNGSDHLDFLFSKKVISIEEYQKLEGKCGTRDKTRHMMLILLSKPAEQWVTSFMKSLSCHRATDELVKQLNR